jgi:hypothetical protein
MIIKLTCHNGSSLIGRFDYDGGSSFTFHDYTTKVIVKSQDQAIEIFDKLVSMQLAYYLLKL